jgi:hypothetical protein
LFVPSGALEYSRLKSAVPGGVYRASLVYLATSARDFKGGGSALEIEA